MANRITFTTENNQTKATFDYENLPDIQTDAIKKVLGITPTGTIDITENGTVDVTDYAQANVDVSGGPQPTLFAPVVTGAVNEVSWANNTSNGGFDVTLTADVDGQTVTSPLTITQEMDGKLLTVTASATNFNDATTTMILTYISSDCGIFFNKLAPTDKWFGIGQIGNNAHIIYNSYETSDTEYGFWVKASEETSFQFSGGIKIIHGRNSISVKYHTPNASYTPNISPTVSTVSMINSREFSASDGNWSLVLTNKNDSSDVHTYTSSTNPSNFLPTVDMSGKTYSFIMNVSLN